MAEKRYFWLKLQQDFFGRKEIKMLRRIAGGDTYTVIYLKMLLKSLQTDGKLYYEGVSDDFIEEIALDIDEEYENVQVTVTYLRSKGLLIDSGIDEVELTSLRAMVGSETASAERKRRQRERDIVTSQSQLGHVEIEKKLDKSKEIKIDEEIKDLSVVVTSLHSQLINSLSENGFMPNDIQPNQLETLFAFVTDDGMDFGVVNNAIKVSSDMNARNFNYVNGILEKKLSQGVKTIADWNASESNFKNRKTLGKKQPDNSNVPQWMLDNMRELEGE